MARRWESKSVEEQIEEARERRPGQGDARRPEEVERQSKRQSFELQRTRLLREIESARDDRHRATLSAGLQFLESKIAELS